MPPMLFDFARTLWDDNNTAVTVEFMAGKAPTRKASAAKAMNAGEVVARLYVQFWRLPDGDGIGGVREVALSRPGKGALGASDLQRFAWKRWLDAARAVALSGGTAGELQTAVRAQHRAGSREREAVANRKRPGRAGHPAEHYAAVLKGYRDRQVAEATDPTGTSPLRQLAKVHGVSENTVKGWLRRARQIENET